MVVIIILRTQACYKYNLTHLFFLVVTSESEMMVAFPPSRVRKSRSLLRRTVKSLYSPSIERFLIIIHAMMGMKPGRGDAAVDHDTVCSVGVLCGTRWLVCCVIFIFGRTSLSLQHPVSFTFYTLTIVIRTLFR